LSIVLFFFFFFSSRRRHTRFDCDWSSDVCSSDLGVAAVNERASPALANTLDFDVFASLDERAAPWATGQLAGAADAAKNAAAHTVFLPVGLFALLGGVRSRALPYP